MVLGRAGVVVVPPFTVVNWSSLAGVILSVVVVAEVGLGGVVLLESCADPRHISKVVATIIRCNVSVIVS